MNRQERRHPERGEVRMVPTASLEPSPVPRPVTLDMRQGVFAHSYKCSACSAEFLTLSWRRERPAEIAASCPECQSPAFHLKSVVLSERATFALAGLPSGDGAVEIYNVPRLLEEQVAETTADDLR